MKPSLGRIVHYVAFAEASDGEQSPGPAVERAAIITLVNDDEKTVSLAVLSPVGIAFRQDVPHDEGKSTHSWHWPERT